MFRATTPRHTFFFKIDPANFRIILVTYSQGGERVLEKNKSDLTFESECCGIYKAHYKLSQEESNLFKAGNVDIQVRAVTQNGDSLASEIKHLKVQDVLNDGVLE